MCTVTIFKNDNGFRVYMNRDERFDRDAEAPPQFLNDAKTIIGPYDPVSGGTWFAVNKSGFWGCLLNGYFEEKQNPAHNGNPKTRGTILLDVLSADDPFAQARAIEYEQYRCFRIIVGSADETKLFVWDGDTFKEEPFQKTHEERVFFMTSSSLRQDEIVGLRKNMFSKWAKEWDGQDDLPAYHTSQEPSPIEGPLMRREYARTTSITALSVSAEGGEMSYWPVPDSGPFTPNFEHALQVFDQKKMRKAV